MAHPLDKLLPLVRKPQQYLGGEVGVIRKELHAMKAKLALAFPDLYEIGACNTGLSILYHIVNSAPQFAAERVFMVDYDMRGLLQRHGLPLGTLESGNALNTFDLVGFTLQYELSYSNIPAMLVLGKIPVLADLRQEQDPIVIAGGPLTTNPAPLSEIMDAFVIGDGEEVVLACLDAVAQNPTRSAKLDVLAQIPGVYVKTRPRKYFQSARIAALKKENYPEKPLVPILDIVQNRLAVEVMRGCSHGCRFCSAGYYYRPVRERSAQDVVSQLKKGVEAGWQEISLLSLSTADYTGLPAVLGHSAGVVQKHHAQISLPSTRLDRFSPELLKSLGLSRRSSITFAPEAGSERLRRVINKGMTHSEILQSVGAALERGFSVIKLYFMIGLPTEEDADIEAIILLIKEIQILFRQTRGRRSLHVSVAPFCPKPGTPFEREPLLTDELIKERSLRIKQAVQDRSTEFHWGGGETARLETLFARGGSELTPLILAAAEDGLLLQSWAEHLNSAEWERLLKKTGISLEPYTGRIPVDQKLPWHLFYSESRRRFLAEEYEKAMTAELSPDCRDACASDCGACGNGIGVSETLPEVVSASDPVFDVSQDKNKDIRYNYQLVYKKGIAARFVPYHDMVRLFERALLLGGAVLRYSEGFSPQPQLSFTYPLSLGFTGLREPFRISLSEACPSDLMKRINQEMPEGLEVIEIAEQRESKALETIIGSAEYTVELGSEANRLRPLLEQFWASQRLDVELESKRGRKNVDLRALTLGCELKGNTLFVRLALGSRGILRIYDFLEHVLKMERDTRVVLPICRTGFLTESGDVV